MARVSPDQSRRILDPLGVLLRQVARLTGSLEEGEAISASQRVALAELFLSGPLRLNELAARMGVSPPTASRAVDALVGAKLVERVTDPDDRRALNIDLTARGRRAVDERTARAAAAFAPAAEALSHGERDELVRLLERMNEALSRPGASAPTPAPGPRRG